MDDENFAHIFKKVTNDYLVSSEDGDLVNMECFSWLDISQEVEMAHTSEPVWQTDLSQIKSIERNDIVPLLPLNDELAD